MPAIFDSLVRNQGLTEHVAWRVSFIVPFIIINAVALGIFFLTDDTPSGKWSDRNKVIEATSLPASSANSIHTPTGTDDKKSADGSYPSDKKDLESPSAPVEPTTREAYTAEVVVAPTPKEMFKVFISPQTLTLAAQYACSFGGELAINSIIGTYYFKNFPKLGQTGSGRWAAMFGLLNVVFRPMGGIVGDIIYHYTDSVWAKKYWIVFCGVATGAFELAIGLVNPHHEATMFGLVAGLAVFMDASNGANFAVVPHVHPFANGIVSGLIGATGNLGGIIFALIFRFNGAHYDRVIWIIGAITIGINVGVSWIQPVPKGQIGGNFK